MCYKGKCLHCIEVETGALIYAILNVIHVGLGTVVSVGGLVYSGLETQLGVQEEFYAETTKPEEVLNTIMVIGIQGTIVFGVLAVACAVSLCFAILLLVGLCKRNAHLVKCYFVFGIVKLVFVGAGLVTYAVGANALSAILPTMVVVSIYGLLLLMIQNTYKKFQAEVPFLSFTNQIAIVEKF